MTASLLLLYVKSEEASARGKKESTIGKVNWQS